jgi:hypothetical protein
MTRFTESTVEDAALDWLVELRDLLLPKLTSGEILVSDVEQFAPEAV